MGKNISKAMAAMATLASLAGCGAASGTSADGQKDILLADPTIFTLDGKYFLAGTQGGNPPGFTVYESDDLKSWTPTDSIPNLAAGTSVFGTENFWAPQFFILGDKTGMFYTANEQVAVAFADSIAGKYAGNGVPVDPSEKNIDPFLFRDDDGKYYLYHVRFNRGNYIWVGEYDTDNNSIKPGTLTQALCNDTPWEHTGAYESDPIMEGPTVVKIDGKYYLFYSANHFMSPDYAVGYAVADSPLGPWKKNPGNPIIHRGLVGENGAGHGDVFTDLEGNTRYVYHVHNSDSVATPRRTRIITLDMSKNADGTYDITADPSSIIRL